MRTAGSSKVAGYESVVVGDIDSKTDWTQALHGVGAVVHAAARAHVMNAQAQDVDLYFETNARGTARLAQAAASAGINRFVYVSSIKVNGEERQSGRYSAADQPHPRDPYGESKWRGEQALLDAGGAMQVAIVRPPLVYGPGVRANFLRLMKWVDKGLPLPLGAVHNKRSLVSVWNLCDLIVRLLRHPLPASRAWLVSDGEDVSTPALIEKIAHAMGRRANLWPVPFGALKLAGLLTGKKAEIARLGGSLAVDISATRSELEWQPPLTMDESVARTVQWYLSEAGRRAD